MRLKYTHDANTTNLTKKFRVIFQFSYLVVGVYVFSICTESENASCNINYARDRYPGL